MELEQWTHLAISKPLVPDLKTLPFLCPLFFFWHVCYSFLAAISNLLVKVVNQCGVINYLLCITVGVEENRNE